MMNVKRTFKKAIIPALTSEFISRLVNYLIGYSIPIFMMHRFADEDHLGTGVSPDHLRNCLGYLSDNNYTFLSIEEAIDILVNKRTLPKKPIVFTMDDGFLEQGEIAASIFPEFKCPLTFFVITGLLDQTLWPWDAKVSWIIDNHNKKQSITLKLDDETILITAKDLKQRKAVREKIRNILKEVDAKSIPNILKQFSESAGVEIPEKPPSQYQPMSWENARSLEKKGIRFAPHSVSHRILSKLPRDESVNEILESWNSLKKNLENPLKVFCYPTGRALDFGPREIEILKSHKFIGAVTTRLGHIDLNIKEGNIAFKLPRIELPNDMTTFVQCCSWIEYIRGKS
jgi:peptidoglycan/xylan/chitin deacetylase (PgdA/CDA1 family)